MSLNQIPYPEKNSPFKNSIFNTLDVNKTQNTETIFNKKILRTFP